MKTMSIDPGNRGAGWALWNEGRLQNFGCVRAPNNRHIHWWEAGRQNAALLHDIGHRGRVEKVYCEFPTYFSGGKGQAAAASGSLVKLSWFVGFIDALFTPEFIPFELVPVNMWKGQLPKEVVEDRICKILKKKSIIRRLQSMPNHAFDAVGIGLFIHGRMK